MPPFHCFFLLVSKFMQLKSDISPKMKILTLLTHPLSSAEHKIYFCLIVFFTTIKCKLITVVHYGNEQVHSMIFTRVLDSPTMDVIKRECF